MKISKNNETKIICDICFEYPGDKPNLIGISPGDYESIVLKLGKKIEGFQICNDCINNKLDANFSTIYMVRKFEEYISNPINKLNYICKKLELIGKGYKIL